MASLTLSLTAFAIGVFVLPPSFFSPEFPRRVRYGTPELVVVPGTVPQGVTDLESAYSYVCFVIKYMRDMFEHWQTSEETLTLGVGDCEDQAVTLCAIARNLGFRTEDVRVVAGSLSLGGVLPGGHVWVEVWINRTWFILDPAFSRADGSLLYLPWDTYYEVFGAKRLLAFNDIYGTLNRDRWPEYWKWWLPEGSGERSMNS